MASRVPIDARNAILPAFRERVWSKYGIVPFPHQRKWIAATEGWEVLEGEPPVPGQESRSVQLPDGSVTDWAVVPRHGGPARFVTDFGAFKCGKSFSSAMFMCAFAAIPGARVSLVGAEYAICSPEFDYLCEFLLSDRGMGLNPVSLQNRPRDGKMWLELENDARFEACSWERKDSLKGKEIDCYAFCEAYQLPGIECFTSNSQNLRARRGFAVFPTTPDRPWVKLLHDMGHGEDAEWHCTCGVTAEVNPHTFDAKAKVRDERLMTREKFQIHYMGQMGDFVGSVFSYQKGQAVVSRERHPDLYANVPDGQPLTPDNLTIPNGWEVVSGGDTGTYYTALTVAFSPDGDAVVIDEYPNYRYVAGAPERDEDVTIPAWSAAVVAGVTRRGARPNLWADANSQFKRELAMYGITLLPASQPVETRTEIAREYFQHGKITLCPWVTILPFELENACWPEEATSAGKYARVKDRDHTLDCLEHILGKRPRGTIGKAPAAPGTWLQAYARQQGARLRTGGGDPHLGRD